MRTIHLALLFPAGALLFSACGGAAPPVSYARSVPVEVITAQSESVQAMIEAPGTVQARDRVVLSSQISGFARDVRVRAGDAVTAGQVLITLDARDADGLKAAAQSGVEEAQAALAAARREAQAAQSMRAAAKASADLAGTLLAAPPRAGQRAAGVSR